MTSFRELRLGRLRDEIGTLHKQADLPVALVYPSPYHVGMSSLGFQTIYRELHALPGVTAERAFLPDDAREARQRREPLCTYESGRPISDFPVVAFSLAYELEIAGVCDCLDLAGIPALSADRARQPGAWPLVVIGGPLTFSNPVPAGPLADVMIMGEAEELLVVLTDALAPGNFPDRDALLADLARRPGFYVPTVHGETPPPIVAADNRRLPAFSQIRTPHTELSNMFLIEPERGCHRGCTYCVMRRSTNGGMRIVEPEVVLSKIPADANKVGLVGAAVTDHPRLPVILRALVDAGREVGISSLRADRLDDEIVGLLRQGGYRTLTTAADGASERLRDDIQRKTKEKHLLRAAELCRAHGLYQLKLYMMVGLPGETMADIEELARFSLELARVAPRLSFGIAPFVAKRNTPLDRQPFTQGGRGRCPPGPAAVAGRRQGRAAPHLAQVGVGGIPPGSGRVRRRAGGHAGHPRGRAVRRLALGPGGGPRTRDLAPARASPGPVAPAGARTRRRLTRPLDASCARRNCR